VSGRGLGGRFGRGARLTRTSVRGVAGLATAKARQLAGGDDASVAEFHQEMAGHLADVLGQMKGAAMKLGQIMSFVDLDLPPDIRTAYQSALATLRDQAPAFDQDAIDQVVHEEYGAPPEAVFASWDPNPIAAASIGQVHAAKLDDGRDVVVKVQYPGVAEAVRADLRNAEAFAPIGKLFAPYLELEPLLDELRERIGDELDYQREAQYQHAFAQRYDGHPFIRVPHVIADRCRARVLVSERVHGRDFDRFVETASDEQRQIAGETIFRYAFGSIGRFRLFNGDPHPGNYLIEEGGPAGLRVAFVDYGSVKLFSRERFELMQRVDSAVLRGDQDAFIAGMRDSGFIPPNATIDEDRIYAWFGLFMRPVLDEQPFTFTPEFATEVLVTQSDPRSPYWGVLRKLNLPPDYLLLNRIQLGINSVLARLQATNDWRAIRAEYVELGAPATELGELDARWWTRRRPEPDPPA